METAHFQLSADRQWPVLWGPPCGSSDGTETSSGTQRWQILTREHHEDLVLAGCCQGILTSHSLTRCLLIYLPVTPNHRSPTQLPGISVGTACGMLAPCLQVKTGHAQEGSSHLRSSKPVSAASAKRLSRGSSVFLHRQHRPTTQSHPNSAPVDRYPHTCIFSSSAT